MQLKGPNGLTISHSALCYANRISRDQNTPDKDEDWPCHVLGILWKNVLHVKSLRTLRTGSVYCLSCLLSLLFAAFVSFQSTSKKNEECCRYNRPLFKPKPSVFPCFGLMYMLCRFS